GVYQQFNDRNPIIVYALTGPDAIGTARHEAIHHLRSYGFLSDAEWSTLTEAAKSEGWAEKFGIERRYKDRPEDIKLEESIAEGYRDWKAKQEKGPGPETPLDKVFRKLDEFLEAIKSKFREILGKEPTWEELFQKVDTGEIGSREGTQPLHPGAYRESMSIEERADNLKANATE